MKQLISKSMLRNSVTALFLVLCLYLAFLADLQADNGNGMRPMEEVRGELENVVVGSFDGLDMNVKRIWISDRVYKLDYKVRVKGNRKKLGLITDLKQGETIKATLRSNDDQSTMPNVILIERQ